MTDLHSIPILNLAEWDQHQRKRRMRDKAEDECGGGNDNDKTTDLTNSTTSIPLLGQTFDSLDAAIADARVLNCPSGSYVSNCII